jgi:transcription initiation factor TFIIB
LRREDPFLTCDEEVHEIIYDHKRAEPVCSKCGLVLDEMKFDFLVESNAVSKRKNSRVGTVKSSNASAQYQSLERNLREAFLRHDVQQVVQEKALELCRVIRRQRFNTRYSVSTVSGALIYFAHRLCRVPVSLADCAGESTSTRKRTAHCYQKLCRQLKLNVPRFGCSHYLSHIARRKKVDDQTVKLAANILNKAREKRIFGGANPAGIAAAALYVAGTVTENGIVQKELAEAAGVSEVTIRVNCRMFRKLLQTENLDERRV